MTLADTPRAWWDVVTTRLGVRTVALALVLAAAGWLVWTEADFGLNATRSPAPNIDSMPGGQIRLPPVRTEIHSLGRRFTAEGASFRVELARNAPWASAIRLTGSDIRHRWLFVSVDGTNLRRRRFNPNVLSYRLRDGRGSVYYADLHGGTGPDEMFTPKQLPRGMTAQSRLGFRIPLDAKSLTLVFEPREGGSTRVHIPLGSG